MKLRGLYAITPDRADSESLLQLARRALEAAGPGPDKPPALGALQYRNKLADAATRRREARALAQLCRARGVPFIVNDEVELALEVDAAGTHLGGEDGDVAAARARLAGRLLGVSCYDSLARARAAAAAGADYLAFGSVFASGTKPAAVRAPLTIFGAAAGLGLPLVAIGGITLENAAEAIQAGAHMVAVISDLFEAHDVAARARAYAELFAHQPAQQT